MIRKKTIGVNIFNDEFAGIHLVLIIITLKKETMNFGYNFSSLIVYKSKKKS